MSQAYTVSEEGEALEVTAAEAVTLARIGLIYQCEECAHTFHLIAPHGFFRDSELAARWADLETALATIRS